jgi:hypothetical protein
MVERINLPTRNVVAAVSQGDQRQIKWFEDISEAVTDLLAGGGGGGGVSDGNKGDITVSGSGAVWQVNAGAISPAKTTGFSPLAVSGDAADLGGTKTAAFISDFGEATDDRVANLLVAGANITLNYNDVANTLTIASTGASGSGSFTLDDGTATTDGVFVMDDGGA